MKRDEFNAAVQADIAALVLQGQQQYELQQARERLALLNAGVPDPVTSMDEPFYWVDKHDEIRDDMKFRGEL